MLTLQLQLTVHCSCFHRSQNAMFSHLHYFTCNTVIPEIQLKNFGICKSLEIPFLARDVIYTSHAYAMMSVSVCLSVCDGSALVHYS